MRKQKVLLTNNRLVLAITLFVLAVCFTLSIIFGMPARAAEGDEYTAEENVMLDGTADTETVFTVPESWVYGTEPVKLDPRAKYEGENCKVGFTLYLNEEQVAFELTSDDIKYYINRYMPAGEYRMLLVYPSVTVEDKEYAPFDATYTFEVLPADISDDVVTEVSDALVNKTFEYIYDGKMHFYSDDVSLSVIDAGSGIYDRGEKMEGVYWSQEECDKYFGGFSMTYNLNRMQNNHYHDIEYFDVTNEDISRDCAAVAPVEPGRYIVYFQLEADNYNGLVNPDSDDRRAFAFNVTVYGEVNIPSPQSRTYTGNTLPEKTDNIFIDNSGLYTVEPFNGWTDVGTYSVTLRLTEPLYYIWKGQTIEKHTETTTVAFSVTKASNDWTVIPDVVRWVEGSYDEAENLVVGEAAFGTVVFEITDADGNVVYNSDGVNKLAELKAGTYNFTASVADNDNYNVLSYSKFIRVLKKQGLPWWGTLCIVLGALAVVAIIILILYKTGVFRLLTDKIVIAIRTKATIDATIAAVRANKVAEAAKISVAQAEANDRAEDRRKARKAAAEQSRNRSQEEKVAALEAKAQATADKAEAMRLKAEAMQARIQTMRANSAEDTAEKPENKEEPIAASDTSTETD